MRISLSDALVSVVRDRIYLFLIDPFNHKQNKVLVSFNFDYLSFH